MAPDSVRLTVEASASIWLTVAEQAENGLRQTGSLDPAASHASGFNFRQGRLGARLQTPDSTIEVCLRLRLEERTDILDAWVGWRVARGWTLRLGQQKVPSTGEVLAPDEELDFITRSTFGCQVGDLSMFRTPYISPVMAGKSYDRDLGLSVHGSWPARKPRLQLLGMVGNGLGAGNYIGGAQSSEFLFSNSPGDLYMGARLEWIPLPTAEAKPAPWRWGGHCSVNHHRNASLDARGPVLDLDRRSWSLDLQAAPFTGHHGGAFVGGGRLRDAWTQDPYRYEFRGWGAWWLWAPGDGPLEFGVRRDVFRGEYQPVDDPTEERHWTLGLNWRPRSEVRIQGNYVRKVTDRAQTLDPADDILFLNVQVALSSR